MPNLYTPSDIRAAENFVSSLKRPAQYKDGGAIKSLKPGVYKQLWDPQAGTTEFEWDPGTNQFMLRDRVVKAPVIKAGANVVVLEASNTVQAATLALQQAAQNPDLAYNAGTIEAWFSQAEDALKAEHGANAALARGGFAEMRPQDWEALSARVEDPLAALQRIRARVENGLYGAQLENDSLLVHVNNVVSSGRSTFENTRLDNNEEKLGHDEFKRLLGAVDHCRSKGGRLGCAAAAALGVDGWCTRAIFIEIGGCTCHDGCYCSAISRRAGRDERLGINADA